MSVKFCFEIQNNCWENCKKTLGGYFFSTPCTCVQYTMSATTGATRATWY